MCPDTKLSGFGDTWNVGDYLLDSSVSMRHAHVGSLICFHVGDDIFISCPMWCVTTPVPPTVSPARQVASNLQ